MRSAQESRFSTLLRTDLRCSKDTQYTEHKNAFVKALKQAKALRTLFWVPISDAWVTAVSTALIALLGATWNLMLHWTNSITVRTWFLGRGLLICYWQCETGAKLMMHSTCGILECGTGILEFAARALALR